MGFWSRTWNGVRSLVQVNAFVTKVLRARRWPALLFTVLLFGVGIWLMLGDFAAGAWLAFAAGLLSVLREAWPAMKDLFGTPDLLLERDREFIADVLPQVQASDAEERDGFLVEHVPQQRDTVLRSSRVDRWLRGASPVAVVDDRKRTELEARLRDNAPMLEAMLRCRARESYRSDPSRVFFNAAKFGLSQGIEFNLQSVRCHRIDYFHSVLTNEAVTRNLVSDEGRAHSVFSGRCGFPASPALAGGEERLRLWPLATSGMADHAGVSTLVVTRDRKLVLWNQSRKAMQSRNLVAPTGSGSCDWSDVIRRDGVIDLKATLVHAMEREFIEESFGGKLSKLARETRVLGYFRWIMRGGKPEFVGVTRADVDSFTLSPNNREVNLRNHAALVHDVPDIQALRSCLSRLREAPGVSVPLWVNAGVLAEAIDEDPAGWGEFLRLPVQIP